MRTWGLRLLALGIAIGIWFNASVEDRLVSSEKVVEASVSYNRPRGFVILNSVQNVNVRVSGSKKSIRQLSPYMVDVSVDLGGQRPAGIATIALTPDNVVVPDGLEVVSIEPNTIRVDLEKEVSQRLPVVPKLEGEPAGGATTGKLEVSPNQVLVIGPEPILSRIDSLTTRPIVLDSRTSSFEEPVEVIPPDPLVQIADPPTGKVTVTVPIQPPAEPPAPPKPRKGKGKKT